MALNIKDPETDALVRRLADVTHESITTAVHKAVAERLERETRLRDDDGRLQRIRAIVDKIASQPVIDDRSSEEILGYDENGLPS